MPTSRACAVAIRFRIGRRSWSPACCCGARESFAGSSSGTLLAAALRYCAEQREPKRVVTLLPDNGNKYLSKMFNDSWMADQGLIERPHHGDLRDIIRGAMTRRGGDRPAGRHVEHRIWRMKLYDVSQLPVLEADRVVGVIDESDLLLAVFDAVSRFADPVRSAMSVRVETVPVTASLSDLLPVFETRPCGCRARRKPLSRPDHRHRSGQPSAPQGRLSMNKPNRQHGPNTRAVHGRQKVDPSTGRRHSRRSTPRRHSCSPRPGCTRVSSIARSQNPTRAAFEAALADSEGGVAAFAFASGLAVKRPCSTC